MATPENLECTLASCTSAYAVGKNYNRCYSTTSGMQDGYLLTGSQYFRALTGLEDPIEYRTYYEESLTLGPVSQCVTESDHRNCHSRSSSFRLSPGIAAEDQGNSCKLHHTMYTISRYILECVDLYTEYSQKSLKEFISSTRYVGDSFRKDEEIRNVLHEKDFYCERYQKLSRALQAQIKFHETDIASSKDLTNHILRILHYLYNYQFSEGGFQEYKCQCEIQPVELTQELRFAYSGWQIAETGRLQALEQVENQLAEIAAQREESSRLSTELSLLRSQSSQTIEELSSKLNDTMGELEKLKSTLSSLTEDAQSARQSKERLEGALREVLEKQRTDFGTQTESVIELKMNSVNNSLPLDWGRPVSIRTPPPPLNVICPPLPPRDAALPRQTTEIIEREVIGVSVPPEQTNSRTYRSIRPSIGSETPRQTPTPENGYSKSPRNKTPTSIKTRTKTTGSKTKKEKQKKNIASFPEHRDSNSEKSSRPPSRNSYISRSNDQDSTNHLMYVTNLDAPIHSIHLHSFDDTPSPPLLAPATPRRVYPNTTPLPGKCGHDTYYHAAQSDNLRSSHPPSPALRCTNPATSSSTHSYMEKLIEMELRLQRIQS